MSSWATRSLRRLRGTAGAAFFSGARHVEERAAQTVGGRARLGVVALLALVLGLDGADFSTVGAVAPQLEPALHASHAEIGLLLTVSQFAAAIGTLPMGVLADRVRRQRLIWISVLVWAAAMLCAGLSTSYTMLLLSRVALGVGTAAAGPTVASLTGDFFPTAERARIYGFILAGDLIGGGFWILLSGEIAALSWRAAFWVLAAASLGVAALIWRLLPEPARGGQSHLRWGDERVRPVEEVPAGRNRRRNPADLVAGRNARRQGRAVERSGASPGRGRVLSEDPGRMRWPEAVRFVLSVRTNLVLIVASSLAYYFLAGIRTFAVVFFRSRYDLGQSSATALMALVGLGAVAGVLAGGRVADRLIGRGRPSARIEVAMVSFLVAPLLFLPALLSPQVSVAMPLFFAAAIGLAAGNAPLDAARLDVMPSRLWGRAESVRTALRTSLQASAPLVFGIVAGAFGGAPGDGLGGQAAPGVAPNHGQGLDEAFLLMLIPLAAAGLILIAARRSYRDDVDAASESEATSTASGVPSAGPPASGVRS